MCRMRFGRELFLTDSNAVSPFARHTSRHCAGRLLPESNYVPPLPAPGEEDLNAATQFPFEMTARPAATQHKPQVFIICT